VPLSSASGSPRREGAAGGDLTVGELTGGEISGSAPPLPRCDWQVGPVDHGDPLVSSSGAPLGAASGAPSIFSGRILKRI
jgi:hypothetical protein